MSQLLDPAAQAKIAEWERKDQHYEIIDGQPVELPLMSTDDELLASWLFGSLDAFVRANNLGLVVSESLFRLDVEGRLQRRPDLAFVSKKRWPSRRAVRGQVWGVVPELAIEVVSPSNTAEEVIVKVRDYFRHGVQLVWVLYGVVDQIYVYESPRSVRVLERHDELDGGSVLPGFRLPLVELFGEESEV